MPNILQFDQHPRKVLERIRSFAADLSKVDYEININQIIKDKSVLMSEIWECLEEGDVMDEHLHFEEDGTYAKLVCHTSDGSIFVDIKMLNETDRLRVLYATKEEA